MGRIKVFPGRLLLCLFVAVAAAYLFAPREPVDLVPDFDAAAIGPDPDAWLAAAEAQVGGIVPGTEKRIVWAGVKGARTDLAIVYLHGFSATSGELRPVPDRVAQALGANLYFARLAGHGLGSERFAGPVVKDWMNDTAEALEIGRRIGRRVIVLATSTGGTLMAEAALAPDLSRDVAGVVFISPNFAIRNAASILLTQPLARYWTPWVAGAERCFEPQNKLHETFWTTCYPTVALMPMAALVSHAAARDYSAVTLPALFVLSPDDQVVSADATEKVIAGWGGPHEALRLSLSDGQGERAEGVDPYGHVLAGDALSPALTGPVVEAILDWARRL